MKIGIIFDNCVSEVIILIFGKKGKVGKNI